MEKVNVPSSIPCSIHPSELIQKIDPRDRSNKHLYCLNCILESNDSKSLAANLISLNEFLTIASVNYSARVSDVKPQSEAPAKYQEVLSTQAETLDRLTEHLNGQKQIIEDLFHEITQLILERINEQKNKYIKLIDQQVTEMCESYANLEKEMKALFPKSEEIEVFYPSKQELANRLNQISTASELETFIKGVKEDMKPGNISMGDRLKGLDYLCDSLKEAASNLPEFATNSLDFNKLVNGVDSVLTNVLADELVLKNPMSTTLAKDSFGINDFTLVKKWLGVEGNFQPNLLYKSSRDGMNSTAFHSKCDKMGPTITFVRCLFKGSSTPSVIGGYLDGCWHSNRAYISSNKAFLFSTTKRVKCEVSNATYAACGVPENGPTFGGVNLFISMSNPQESYVNPGVAGYKNVSSLLDSDDKLLAYFTPLEVEVYSLK